MIARIVLGCALMPGLIGCASTPGRPVISPAIDISFDSGDGRMSRYEVKPTGRLRFAGGLDVVNKTWSWTGYISPETGTELGAIIERNGLMARPPETPLDGPGSWEVTIVKDGRRRSFSSTGADVGVEQLWIVLFNAGQQRLNADLDRLPKPDIDRLVKQQARERKEGG